jgi:ADP-ribose pyrophosphatase
MALPRTAKRVFSGVIFDVYQWKQRVFDGSIRTFEALRRCHTVEVIATKGSTIYIARQRQPRKGWTYSFFGGRQEPRESPLAAAKRELLEESGLSSKDWRLFKVYAPYSKIDWKIYVYVARDCCKVREPKLDGGEQIRTVSVDFPGFVKRVTGRDFWGREIAYDILKMKEERKIGQLKKVIFG